MPERVPAGVPTASRRTALGLVAGGAVALAAGCDGGSSEPGADDGTASAGPSAPTRSAAPQDADTRLVAQVRSEVLAMLTVVRGALGRPPLAEAVRALERMHLAHLAALDGEDPGRPVPRSQDPVAAVARRLATRERSHQRDLARAADRAVSGDLAALLATMTAGAAQHLELLP